MATAIKTVMTYPLNSSTVNFTIPFEYLARKFVTVTLIGTNRKVLVLNQDYRFTTKTQITTTKAWGSGDGYSTIEIRRYTSATDRLVDFADGSILRAYDLNISQIQTLHVAEEARDLTADTIGVNNDGNLDARGRRIVNVADATSDYDAINLRQVKTMSQGAYQSAQAAAGSATAAANSATAAATSASNASTQRGAAEAARDRAETAATNADADAAAASQSKTDARTYWQASVTKAAEAAASATAASGSATTATQQADRAKTEADKLANNNALATSIKSISGNDVQWKGAHWFPAIELSGSQPFIDFHYGTDSGDYTHRIIADNANRLVVSSSFRVVGNLATSATLSADNGLVVSNGAAITGTLSATGRASFNELVEGRGFFVFDRSAAVANRQGIHMLWNETNAQGEAAFVCNKGGGTGGFVFRTVNLANTQETGSFRVTGDGIAYASNEIRAGGSGAARLSITGNVFGSTWNNKWLSNYLSEDCFTGSVGGRVKGWLGIGAGFLTLTVDGTAYSVTLNNSDERLKSNIEDADSKGAYDAIKNVRLRSFDMKTFPNQEKAVHWDYGFIAQQAEEFLTGAVVNDEMTTYKQIDVLALCGYLMGAIKHLQEKVETLEGNSKE